MSVRLAGKTVLNIAGKTILAWNKRQYI